MHDWEGVGSKGFAAIFRAAEVAVPEQGRSNATSAMRA
jgi:hypothetical protein